MMFRRLLQVYALAALCLCSTAASRTPVRHAAPFLVRRGGASSDYASQLEAVKSTVLEKANGAVSSNLFECFLET